MPKDQERLSEELLRRIQTETSRLSSELAAISSQAGRLRPRRLGLLLGRLRYDADVLVKEILKELKDMTPHQ